MSDPPAALNVTLPAIKVAPSAEFTVNLFVLKASVVPLDIMVNKLSPIPPASDTHVNGETATEKQARFESIAQDIQEVVWHEDETPMFQGPNGREKSAIFVATYAFYESSFRKSVDTGTRLGDSGRSWCLMQLNLGKKGKTAEGWIGQDLVNDRTKCIRAGYHVMRRAMGACSKLPVAERMASYVSGNCDTKRDVAAFRYRKAMGLYSKFPLKKFIQDADDLAREQGDEGHVPHIGMGEILTNPDLQLD